MTAKVKIKDWKKEERPREKMLNNGAASLSNTELIAILIRSGNSFETAIDLSRKILSQADNSLNKLSQLSVDELTLINGIGKTKALSILAAFELSSRMEAELPEERPQILSSNDVVKLLRPLMKNLDHEECWILYLNRANRVVQRERVSIGGISSTIMDTKLIIRHALNKFACGMILAHNHPSGTPYPGTQDKKQTKILQDAAAFFDISILDHVIIAKDKFYSFCDHNLL
ncbi:MAG: DNA repair protein RadC [Bacteroidales bacterium]